MYLIRKGFEANHFHIHYVAGDKISDATHSLLSNEHKQFCEKIPDDFWDDDDVMTTPRNSTGLGLTGVLIADELVANPIQPIETGTNIDDIPTTVFGGGSGGGGGAEGDWQKSNDDLSIPDPVDDIPDNTFNQSDTSFTDSPADDSSSFSGEDGN